ncbi:hypothetical protein SAHL_14925 [Salinisphaera orenii YIM 95161]|uniref:Uncharacterized protein n=1 Tax=Salinisphaera orenii YIM 95161 TaxID=1051139 RepID=A0A423PHN0_9GAMM|nr:hypothetical protein SAHL_14925 [Salinisphaera halophila YIM 95161]
MPADRDRQSRHATLGPRFGVPSANYTGQAAAGWTRPQAHVFGRRYATLPSPFRPGRDGEPGDPHRADATCDLRPATCDRRPATGDRRPATGIRHPASGIRHPASGIRHPMIG